MNERLLRLYSQYWEGMIQNIYKANIKDHPSAYPILIQATQHYQEASRRIMFCGQETLSWGTNEFPNPDTTTPNDLMSIYNAFVNRNNDGGPIKRPGYYIKSQKPNLSPYWNFQWNIMQHYPECGFVAQNIVKIGKRNGKGCDDIIYELTKEFFPVWKQELEILQPDCILFLTGLYDQRIREIAGDFDIVPIDGTEGLVAELKFKDFSMPKAYRTNHPGLLQRKGKYSRVTNAITDILKNT